MEENLEITKDDKKDKFEIDLNNFEKVILHNNKEYVKFINKKDGSVIMLDITHINMPIKDYLEFLQNGSINYKTNDASYNAYGIIKSQEKSMIDLKFEDIEMVDLNRIDNPDNRKIVQMFKENKNRFIPKIKYVNPSLGIALNEEGRVLEIFYNSQTEKYESRYADTVAIKSEEKVVNNNLEGNFDGIDFEATMDYLEIDNKEIPLGHESINIKEIEQYDNNEGALKDAPMSEYKKGFITRLLAVYRKRKQLNQQKELTDKPKVLQKIKPKEQPTQQAAFVSNNLTLFIGGFTTGIIFAIILYFAIKTFF